MESKDVKQSKLPAEKFWKEIRKSILLIFVGGGIDTIGFIALFGFFTNHVTGNLVLAGASWVEGGDGIWIKLSAIPLFIITVALTKLFIDQRSRKKNKHQVIYNLFMAEAMFLTAFMAAGLYFSPFDNADSIYLALTAGLGLIALAIRNTSGKALMANFTPGTVMTGNTTAFGINITNYLRNKTPRNKQKLKHSTVNVLTFICGAFLGAYLYETLGFWSIAFFIPAVLRLAHLSINENFLPSEDD
ncbi:DUF1275 domain-containing protein [Flavobacteriaceae bacterium Ap0902]|nr:DUF1275 domain-containing protein [Flavobacteriaceae bacterium Ap0902]